MQLFDVLYQNFHIAIDADVTIEANPDDLTAQKVKELRKTPVNRFSIGVQSFQDADLQFMNRAHNAEESLCSIKRVQDSGWENITIDLIYGTLRYRIQNGKTICKLPSTKRCLIYQLMP